MTDQIVNLLNAAKLLADREGHTFLIYLISMAMIEARLRAHRCEQEGAA